MTRRYPLLALAAVALAAGCGRQPAGATAAGRLTLDGRPLPDALVQLYPKDDLSLGLYYGSTDADGRFTLRGREGPVLKPGRYVVLVKRLVKKDGKPPGPDEDQTAYVMPGSLRNTVPEVYSDRERSPHTVELVAGHNDLPTLELKSRP
jgi:hypothetical protein